MKNSSTHILLSVVVFFFCKTASAQFDLPEIPDVNTHLVIASGTNGAPTLVGGDRFGNGISRIGDLDNDGIEDIVIGAPLDDDGGTDRGAVYVCFMRNDRTIRAYNKISNSDMGTDLANADYFGWSVAGIGDLNNDGEEDIAVGTLQDDDGGTDRGAVYIIFLDSLGNKIDRVKLSNNTNGFPNNIVANSGNLGSAVALLGDINNDGVDDLAFGAYNNTVGSTVSGSIYTVLMNTNGTADTAYRIAENVNGFTDNLDANDAFGHCIAGAGDLDGDGIPDMIVGAPGDDDGFSGAGAMYILYMESNGTVDTTKKLAPPFFNKYFPFSTSLDFPRGIAIADINQDGQQDIIAGGPTSTSLGQVFILTLDTLENVTAAKRFTEFSSWTYDFPSGNYRFGMAVAAMSDLGNDGKPEVLVNAASHSQGASAEGAVIVLTLDSLEYDIEENTVSKFIKYGDYSGNFTGTMANGDQWGRACKVGDVNGDGNDDIAIGEHLDDDGGSNRGAVWILFLDSLGYVSSQQKISSSTGGLGSGIDNEDRFGGSLAAPGDINGDTIPDLIVGAFLDDDGGTDNGAIYILYLNANGTVKSKVKISETSGGFQGNISTGGNFGISVACIGDVNNDGVNDLAVGEFKSDDGGTDRGAVWILFMTAADTVSTEQSISDTQGDFTATFANSDNFGISVSKMGDFDGDTIPDILVGAYQMDNSGAAFILYLGTDGKVDGYKKINYASGNFPVSLPSGDQFGTSVTMINDLDGDDINEIIITQNKAKSYTQQKGGFWITYLDSVGNVTKANFIGENEKRFYAAIGGDILGTTVDFYGTNDDGLPVILVGATLDDEGGSDRGAAYMITLFHFSPAQSLNNYVMLQRKLDGGHYRTQKYLYFKYRGEYNTGDLKFNIYDKNHTLVVSNVTHPTIITNMLHNDSEKTIGENKFRIDLSCVGTVGYYILEVINEKDEKFYLRIRREWGYGCNNQIITPGN